MMNATIKFWGATQGGGLMDSARQAGDGRGGVGDDARQAGDGQREAIWRRAMQGNPAVDDTTRKQRWRTCNNVKCNDNNKRELEAPPRD